MRDNRPLPKLDFNITNRCNFRCRHCCFNSGETEMAEFSLEKIRNVLDEFVKLGGKRIDVTGGEPTLGKDYLEIIFYAKKIGLKVELVTNGSLLDGKQLKYLRAIGLDGIAISLDGSDYETYSLTRLVSREVYEQVVRNIKLVAEYGFYLKINTVVRNSNLDDIVKITEQAIKFGAKEHGLYYFTPVGRGAVDFKEVVDPLRWLKLVRDELAEKRRSIKLSLETAVLENALHEKAETECYLKNPWHLQILPDGNVYPCAIMAARQLPCGNLYEKSLTEIWQDENLWNGFYYEKNVLPLIDRFGTCVDFGEKFRHTLSKGYKPVCLMCKYRFEELQNEK